MKFAMAGLASIAMATTANAAAILGFSQQDNAQTPVVYPPNGTGTTINSTGTGSVNGWIPVFVTIGQGGGDPQPAFMKFTTPLTTGNAATTNGGTVNQTGFTGTIEFNFQQVSNPLTNILTINFNGGLLAGLVSGKAVGLTASTPPNTVTYMSTNPNPLIANLFAGLDEHDFNLSFTGLVNPLGTSGTGNNASSIGGLFSAAVIPEPSSIVMLSISALAGLGVYGVRRFRASAV